MISEMNCQLLNSNFSKEGTHTINSGDAVYPFEPTSDAIAANSRGRPPGRISPNAQPGICSVVVGMGGVSSRRNMLLFALLPP